MVSCVGLLYGTQVQVLGALSCGTVQRFRFLMCVAVWYTSSSSGCVVIRCTCSASWHVVLRYTISASWCVTFRCDRQVQLLSTLRCSTHVQIPDVLRCCTVYRLSFLVRCSTVHRFSFWSVELGYGTVWYTGSAFCSNAVNCEMMNCDPVWLW